MNLKQSFKRVGLVVVLIAGASSVALASAGSGIELMHANVDVSDKEALARGAQVYKSYCFACHGLSYMRYNRMGKDIGFDDAKLKSDFLDRPDMKAGDLMANSMKKAYGKTAFGTAPPDLTLIARVRGEDWLYTYLNSFYADKSRPLGMNNLLFKDVGMPFVLSGLQGQAMPVIEQHRNRPVVVGVTEAVGGSMSHDEYQAMTHDLVTFLSYTAEPKKLARHALGYKVLLFLLFFGILSYLLKREYWLDVK